jgi:tetratricopeptide (TPR) repeat protein/energy-coupling factor transporter ATP-binding protein EcfA2
LLARGLARFDRERLRLTAMSKHTAQASAALTFAPTTGSPSPAKPEELFVGRAAPLELLDDAYRAAADGQGESVLVCGEAGMGKSTLLRQFAKRVRAGNGQVLFAHGRNDPGAPALWPWIEVLRRVLREGKPSSIDVAPLLQAFSPWLPSQHRSLRLAVPVEGASEFIVHDTLVQLVLEVARRGPLLLVLEDVHDFDAASLDVTARLLQQLHGETLLMVASCRLNDEPRAREGYSLSTLATVSRVVPLEGLVRADVHALMTGSLRQIVPSHVADAVYRRSEGNPLYVTAVVSALSASAARLDALPEGAQLELPASLRLAGQQHLGSVPAACQQVLKLASVLGRAFEVSTLARFETLRCDTATLDAHLHRACRERVLHRVTAAPGHYRFSHPLLREVLQQQWDPDEQRKAHGEAARALAWRGGEREPSLQTRIARHLLAFASEESLRRAVSLALEAGRAAEARGAYSAAADAFEVAVSALRKQIDASLLCSRAQPRASTLESTQLRGELAHCLLDLADALRRSGQPACALAHFAEVHRLARSLADRRLTVDVALAMLDDSVLLLSPKQLEVCELSSDALEQVSASERVRLLAGLGGQLCYTEQRARGQALVASAAELFDRCDDDPLAHFAVLRGRFHALDESAPLSERRDLIERCASAALRCHDSLSLPWIEGWRLRAATEDADAVASARHRERLLQLAQRAGPVLAGYARAISASDSLLRGNLNDAERLSRESLQLGAQAHHYHATLSFLFQSLRLQRYRGDVRELLAPLQQATERFPHVHDFRATLSVVYTELGQMAEARLQLARVLEATQVNVFALCQLAEAVRELAEPAQAQQIYLRLLPFEGRCALTLLGVVCNGAVAHFLGLAAYAAGRTRDAVLHFEAALVLNDRLGALPALARTHLELARVLSDSQEVTAAHAHAQTAGGLFESLGLTHFAARAQALCDAMPAALRDGGPERVLVQEGEVHSTSAGNVFLRKGSYWELSYRGRDAQAGDLKGARYLAILLGSPGRAFHVADLLMAVDGVAKAPVIVPDEGSIVQSVESRDQALDARSIAAYRARMRELAEELEEAEAMQDLGRTELLGTELSFLQTELVACSRVRHAPTERARKAVYNRIRQSIEEIERVHPELGRHLTRSVKTGVHCTYLPEREGAWRTSE